MALTVLIFSEGFGVIDLFLMLCTLRFVRMRAIFVDSFQNFGKRSEKSYRSIVDALSFVRMRAVW